MTKAGKPAPCAIHGLLQDLTHPWTLHILYELCHNGPTRFSKLRRQVDGISSRVLTERLRVLEQKGFVFRKYETTIPPAVTYGITTRMRDIGKVLGQLEQLAPADGNGEFCQEAPAPSMRTLAKLSCLQPSE